MLLSVDCGSPRRYFNQYASWFELMAEFDFKFAHRKQIKKCDALSRCASGENFPDDCPFRYDNDLVNEAEHVEDPGKIDMFFIDFRECQS